MSIAAVLHNTRQKAEEYKQFLKILSEQHMPDIPELYELLRLSNIYFPITTEEELDKAKTICRYDKTAQKYYRFDTGPDYNDLNDCLFFLRGGYKYNFKGERKLVTELTPEERAAPLSGHDGLPRKFVEPIIESFVSHMPPSPSRVSCRATVENIVHSFIKNDDGVSEWLECIIL